MSRIDPARRRRYRRALSEAQNHRCCYCGAPMTDDPGLWSFATIEHVHARGSGGSHRWSNLAMACWSCNHLRGHMPAMAWFWICEAALRLRVRIVRLHPREGKQHTATRRKTSRGIHQALRRLIERRDDMEYVALSALTLAAENVRKTDRKEDHHNLVASIRAHGLLHNLVVRQEGDAYAVVDGGRRLAALQELAKKKGPPIMGCRYDEDGKEPGIPVQIIDAEDAATELSLAANVERVNMHPVDQYEAFAKLTVEGLTPEQIGFRFGMKPREVAQVLALGNLCDAARKALRAGHMEMKGAMALTTLPDAQAQEQVMKAAKQGKHYNTWQIERACKEDRKAVGRQLFDLEDYKARGGTITTDLFAEDGAGYFDDLALYAELEAAVINDKIAELKKAGWGIVEMAQNNNFRYSGSYPSVSEKLAKKKRATAAAILFLDYQGKLAVWYCHTPEQVKAARKAERQAAKAQSGEAEAAATEAPELSNALSTDMKAVRTLALQASILSGSQTLGLRIAAYMALTNPFAWKGMGHEFSRATAHLSRYADQPAAKIIAGHLRSVLPWLGIDCTDETPIERLIPEFEALRDRRADIWSRLRGLHANQLSTLIGMMATLGVDTDDRRHGPTLDLANERELAPAELWRPDTGFWARVPKDYILAAVTATCGEDVAKRHAGMKKADLVRKIAPWFASPSTTRQSDLGYTSDDPLEPSMVAALAAWLPHDVGFDDFAVVIEADEMADEMAAEIEAEEAAE